MHPIDKPPTNDDAPDREDLAAEAFLRRRAPDWRSTSTTAGKLDDDTDDPAQVDAMRRVERAWQAVGDHAATPELMALRERALARARRTSARRWLHADMGGRRAMLIAAAILGVAVTLGIILLTSPFAFGPDLYQTDIGEQRVVELEDRSRVALDAQTRLAVRFSADARVVELTQGQAQFSVAKDPTRPFRVEAGGRTIVAVGTSFTVEYVDQRMRVALLEGKVAVVPRPEHSVSDPVIDTTRGLIELTPGQELRVREDGETTLIAQADMEAATAWRHGKVIFRNEQLGDAVRRLNRYSRLQLEIDDADLAAMQVNGVFEAGDTTAFAQAVQAYLPVAADYSQSGVIRLRSR